MIMAFPIFNMTLVTITRLNKGIKVYLDSRDHAWDMIRFLGLTREATVNFILFLNLVLVSSGILLFFIEESPLQTLLVVAFGTLLAFIGTQLYKNFLYLRYNILAILTDLFAVNLSFVAYYLIKYKSGLLPFTSYVPPEALAVPLAWINIFWIILFSAMGLYDVSFERKFSRQFRIVFKSVIVAAVTFLVLNYRPGMGFQISILSTVIFIALLLAIIVILRFILYKIALTNLEAETGRLNAVLVRRSEMKSYPLETILKAPIYNVLGYVGPESESEVPRLGSIDKLGSVLRETKTARIILDLEESDSADLRPIFKAPYYMETVFLAPSRLRNSLLGLRRYPTVNEDLDIISLRLRSLFPLILRRLIDVAVALFLIIALSPYWAVKLLTAKSGNKTDTGGLNIVTQQEIVAPLHYQNSRHARPLISNPQVLRAILRGWIGFYGPTIDCDSIYTAAKNSIPGFWRKFLVKPGLFGPGYAAADLKERFELDLEYLEKTSFTGDLIMIIKRILRLDPKGRIERHA